MKSYLLVMLLVLSFQNVAFGDWIRANPSYVTGANSQYLLQSPQNLMDGKTTFDSVTGQGWNAGPLGWNIPNWVTIDFLTPRNITKFAFNCYGDTTHDVKDFDIQIPNGQDWTTVASFTGASGTNQQQVFTGFAVNSSKFRWNIRTRFSIYQAWATEIYFYEETCTTTNTWLANDPSYVVAANDQYEQQSPQTLMDGSTAFNSTSGWNANDWNVPNWVVFDFKTQITITGFLFYGYGDTTHDVKDFDIQIPNGQDWTTVASFTGASGTNQKQVFTGFTATSQRFRWNIRTRYTIYQAYVTEVQFQIAETGCWLKDYPSWVTGADAQYLFQSPQNLMDGSTAFDSLTGQGWNAGGDWTIPNWVTFDFVTPRTISKFALYSYGDVTHDTKYFDIQIPNGQDWTTVASFTGASGTNQRQEFSGFKVTSSKFRWYIETRYSTYQTWATEVEFFAIVNPVVSPLQDDVSQIASHSQSSETQDVSQDASRSQATADGISVPMGVVIGVAVVCGLIIFLLILVVIAFMFLVNKNYTGSKSVPLL